MFSGLFKCKECEGLKETIKALEKHNTYLQKLVDKLLPKAGIAPVKPVKEETEPPSEKDQIIEKGGEVYGE